MKIRKVELQGHPILGNLKLDFTDEQGRTIDTIIFAGENGMGKTAILDLLYQFSMFELRETKRCWGLNMSVQGAVRLSIVDGHEKL